MFILCMDMPNKVVRIIKHLLYDDVDHLELFICALEQDFSWEAVQIVNNLIFRHLYYLEKKLDYYDLNYGLMSSFLGHYLNR